MTRIRLLSIFIKLLLSHHDIIFWRGGLKVPTTLPVGCSLGRKEGKRNVEVRIRIRRWPNQSSAGATRRLTASEFGICSGQCKSNETTIFVQRDKCSSSQNTLLDVLLPIGGLILYPCLYKIHDRPALRTAVYSDILPALYSIENHEATGHSRIPCPENQSESPSNSETSGSDDTLSMHAG